MTWCQGAIHIIQPVPSIHARYAPNRMICQPADHPPVDVIDSQAACISRSVQLVVYETIIPVPVLVRRKNFRIGA